VIAFLKNVLAIRFLYTEQSEVVQMDTYWPASIHPSTSVTLPTLFLSIQPHTMMFPPPNFTVPWTSLSINLSTTCFHINCSPYDPILLTLVSPDQITLFQPSTEHWSCLRAKAYHFFLFMWLFFFVTALNNCYLSTILTVCRQSRWGLMM
jgi:hypothetical protein